MNKKIIGFILSALLAVTGCTSENNTETVSQETTSETTIQEVTSMHYEIDTSKPLVALTFDDGPNITTTVQILDKLEKYQVPASFFLVGNNISESTAKVVKRAYDMGCEIGNHSKSHDYMNKMSAEDIKAEVDFVSDKVEEITGEAPKFFRPPYIAVNSDMYDNIDMPFICGVGCNDWDPKVTVQERIDNTINQVQDGTIILLHDAAGNNQTVEALDGIITALQEQGYQFVTVSELFEARGIDISADDTNLYTHVK